MRFVFDDNDSYEAFQFIWIALTLTAMPVKSVRQLMVLNGLMTKLASVSYLTPEGGRVLSKECELELSDDERVQLLDAFVHTPWRPEVLPYVRRACIFLGAEFDGEPDGRPGHSQVH